MNGACNVKLFWPAPWGPGALGRGQKVKYHLNSITKSISKIFILNFVCVLTNERYKHFRQDFHSDHWVMPKGWDFGALGVPRGSKKIFFSNMVMWYIKWTGMTSRTKCK